MERQNSESQSLIRRRVWCSVPLSSFALECPSNPVFSSSNKAADVDRCDLRCGCNTLREGLTSCSHSRNVISPQDSYSFELHVGSLSRRRGTQLFCCRLHSTTNSQTSHVHGQLTALTGSRITGYRGMDCHVYLGFSQCPIRLIQLGVQTKRQEILADLDFCGPVR
ncbi:hypothetical protein Ae201684P_021289 [Aphanomyces euteiches]|uniref:Uncharacterized protein n=1 Tax=Aphanomyces euteiches TaxID=100861 RepID=A0A6G0X768_9STRA|nr:hypothetical protein Ae201684_007868 [Aphanomyces euteiches]KAH9067122.1 hypothetical protein Ae201684P_021289 [Aphanomyces euteiches]